MEKEAKAIKRKEDQNQLTLSDLSLDIVLHILSNLPANALLNCRWVCKSWLTLVREPRLAKMHLIRSSRNENNPSIIFHRNGDYYLLDDIVDSNVAVMLQLPFMKERFRVLGSCNGLVCILILTYPPVDHTRIYVFNPITGEYVKIPDIPFNFGNDGFKISFCYHPLTDEYKILFAYQNYEFYGDRDMLIHTLGSNSWRRIKDIKSLSKNKWWDVKLNGAIHWLPSHSYPRLPIFCFDVGKEEFGVIEHPAEVSKMKCILAVLGGCLSLSYLRYGVYGDKIIEIWLMKEYGVKESWSKQFVIEAKAALWDYTRFARPLCILNNGVILIEMNGSLVSYDPKSKVTKRVNVRLISKHGVLDGTYDRFHEALIHKGSFVSLRTNSGGLTGQQ